MYRKSHKETSIYHIIASAVLKMGVIYEYKYCAC